VNHAVTALMGERDYIGLPVRDAVPELVSQGYIAILDQVYTTGKPFVAYGKPATIRRAPDAAPVECFLNFVYQPIFDAHGKVEGIFIEGNDVTEQYVSQRMAEEKMRQEAQHKDEFLAMLAHELRNPLAPIGSAADLLALGRPNEATVAKASAIIRRQVTHMSGLIDDLLDVSRVTRGLVTLARIPTDVVAVAREALEQVRPLIMARHHRLEVDLPPQPVLVAGDSKRLVQVLANLLNNAAKYTHDGGAITLRLARIGQRVVIDVTDTGIGMTAAVLANAFVLFTQAERTPDRSQGGLGIGLALVKSIVELHDGTVTAASPGIDGGSTFTISLPHAQTQALPGPARDVLPTGGQRRRVLVVDDNVDAAELLALFLAARGHHVMVEHSAAAAVQCAQDNDPDVCMLDIGLPEMDGNALARRLRALPGMARALLIAITGYGTQADRHHAAAAGFDHYLVKLVGMTALLNLIE
jgi:signal transduction histidine kinase/CheY-like chemotaxis protein